MKWGRRGGGNVVGGELGTGGTGFCVSISSQYDVSLILVVPSTIYHRSVSRFLSFALPHPLHDE